MSILVDQNSKVLVQGITGNAGLFHTSQMLKYGTNIVAGVTPGKGGEWVLDGKIPVFDLVATAKEMTGADVSILFVPARNAMDAIYEAADAKIQLLICITSGIPVQDMMRVKAYLSNKNIRLIGPNSPGLMTPSQANIGIIPGDIAIKGNVGLVSRSGTLTYEVLYNLQKNGIGISTCVGIGSDPILGTGLVDILRMFEADLYTEHVVIIGEIGGNEEEKAADFILGNMSKPVIAFIAGKTAPEGTQMGHAGAIVAGASGNAINKIKLFESIGVRVARFPGEIPNLLSF
jgi:succinyl-CoA synthetase alpha subunit